MDANNIIYLLRCIGKSQAQLARDLGISGGVVNNVIHNRITSHAVATYIAELLGSNVKELWPQRYIFKPRGRTSHRSEQQKSSVDGGAS